MSARRTGFLTVGQSARDGINRAKYRATILRIAGNGNLCSQHRRIDAPPRRNSGVKLRLCHVKATLYFGQTKFDANVARDRSVHDQLLDAGWRVATVWECALRRPEETALAANLLAAWLRSSAAEIQIGNADVIADENAG